MRNPSYLAEPSIGELPGALASLASLKDNAVHLSLLIKQLKTSVGVVPFVGAGMSVPFGFPAWRSFLEKQAHGGEERQRIVGMLDRGQYEEAAEAIQETLGKEEFQRVLKETFSERELPNPFPAAAILQLPRLCTGPVLTTNFDPVLEKVFENAQRPFDDRILGMKEVKKIGMAFNQNHHVLVKLHGDADDQSGRVLTKSDYKRAYGKREPLEAVLRFSFQHPLLFLGCSLGNDRTVRVLDALAKELRKHKAGALLGHFAVMERPETPPL